MVGDKARAFYDEAAKERQAEQARRNQPQSQKAVKLPPLEKSDARDAAGKALGVSGSLIDRAATVAPRSRDFPSPVLLSCRFLAGSKKNPSGCIYTC